MSVGSSSEGGNSQGNDSDAITSDSLKNKVHGLASDNDVSIEIMSNI